MRTMLLQLLLALSLLTSGLAVGGSDAGVAARAQEQPLDLLIKSGAVVDGSGSDPVVADVGIRGDRIVFIGGSGKSGINAARTIDATGMVVAPGFIDPHTHTLEDLSDPNRKSNLSYLMQGVTTVITGNDGSSSFPIADTLQKWTAQGIGTNAGLYVGQGTIRGRVVGQDDVAPTPEQLARMKAMVAQALDEGAWGMSTGLYYAPGSYARTEEVIELAKVAAEKGGIYDSHMRDEGSYSIGLLGSIEETIRIGREAKIPVHISHIKALGTDTWGKSTAAIELIRKARAEGIEVTADQYPYTASGSSIVAALVPRWAEAGGARQLLRRIDDPVDGPRIRSEMEQNLKRRNGADSILITGGRDKQLVGKTLAQISGESKKSPIEAALTIIKSQGDASIASFNMNGQDIENFMRQAWVMTGSDGSAGHPRKYGTFPRKLRIYVYDKKLITLPFAIRASSAMTAQMLRIPDRGLLRTGYFADVIVYDPKTIRDAATYEHPQVLAEGMRYVIVNGKLAVEEGKYTGALAGRVLKRAKL
jgi:N-acyl-D-amino-acid deacylase